MVEVGLLHGMGRHKLWTTNTVDFIDGNLNAQRYLDEILRPIVVPFFNLMFQHDNALPRGSVHNSWKLKMSQFFHGLHTHPTCHPLSMFGMLWIDVYDSVFQFPPISCNFAQPLKRSGTTFHRPQSTA
jgi:hypothetical protein